MVAGVANLRGVVVVVDAVLITANADLVIFGDIVYSFDVQFLVDGSRHRSRSIELSSTLATRKAKTFEANDRQYLGGRSEVDLSSNTTIAP